MVSSSGSGSLSRRSRARTRATSSLRLERLHHVVVGAGLQADHDVDGVGLGRQHHDRHAGLGADLAAHLDAVDARAASGRAAPGRAGSRGTRRWRTGRRRRGRRRALRCAARCRASPPAPGRHRRPARDLSRRPVPFPAVPQVTNILPQQSGKTLQTAEPERPGELRCVGDPPPPDSRTRRLSQDPAGVRGPERSLRTARPHGGRGAAVVAPRRRARPRHRRARQPAGLPARGHEHDDPHPALRLGRGGRCRLRRRRHGCGAAHPHPGVPRRVEVRPVRVPAHLCRRRRLPS